MPERDHYWERGSTLSTTPNAEQLNREKLEILDGSRAGNVGVKRRAAVRIEDLTGILQILPKVQATALASGSPTFAQYNTLLNDVTKLHDQLMIVAKALNARLVP
jgi:hypothetical protein